MVGWLCAPQPGVGGREQGARVNAPFSTKQKKCLEEGTNTAAALASLLAERVDLLERVDQLERGLDDLGAQVSYLASALQSIQLGRMPLA